MVNPFEESARLRKAIKLVAVMIVNGWTDDDLLARMQDDHWLVVAQLANVSVPSSITRQLVRERLRESRRFLMSAAG